jgi:flagellar motor switch protein FliG
MQVNGTTSRMLRKAAILLASLDGEEAASLLRAMSPAQSHSVRKMLDQLGSVDEAERQEAIEDFLRAVSLAPVADAAGIELDAPTARGIALAGGRGAGAAQDETTTPFRFLQEAAPRKLVPFLEREHPQTVAVVLSHLPAPRAAEILAHLSGGLQLEVARRLVDLEETDPEVLREVERGLESWLSTQARTAPRTGAQTPLAAILGAADPRSRQSILSNLARHDRQLADGLDTNAGSSGFVELESLDSVSLATLLKHADEEVMILALAGASSQFAERMLSLLGSGASDMRQALRTLGPLRMSEIEAAQRQLADLARALQQRGEIPNEPWAHLSVAV